ncbi:MAG: choice-of-anchor D domain-containing protein [Deltaproteobacteria bacterium]|nr:choice-of-anchor D domain-containing protein [Deltaproteobacteria bacterium]
MLAATTVTSCGGADEKTFVLITLKKGNLTDLMAVKSVTFDLMLDTVTQPQFEILTPNGLPAEMTTASLEIVKGAGLLEVKAVARMAGGGAISMGTSYVNPVVRDKTNNVTVEFGITEPRPNTADGSVDLAMFVSSVSGTHDFGTVVLNKMSMPTRITIRNTGSAKSGPITTSALSGSNPAAFAIVGNDCRSKDMGLAISESCTVTVQANPAGTAGQAIADLRVVAASGATVNVPLQVTGAATSMVTGAPDDHDFGNTTNAGGMSAPRTFTFTNAGGATSAPTVTLTGTDAGSFMITGVNTCAGNPIAAAGTCTVDVLFKPTTPGRQIQAQLTLAAGTTVTAVSMGGTVP